MTPGPTPAAPWRRALALLSALPLVVHLLVGEGYGYFRDELYYLACAQHLDLGYVDHPPLIAWIVAAVRASLGDSLLALRLVPAFAHAGTVWTTGVIAAELGGRRFAQLLAALTTLLVPVYLSLASVLSMNALDVLLWAVAGLLAIRALRGNPGQWSRFGAVAGLGLLNKLSFVFLGAGLVVGLVLARRDVLRDRYMWLGAAIAAVIALPHLVWQVTHGWPTLEFMANARAHKNVALGPLAFMREQALQIGPAALLLWVPGLVWLLGAQASRAYRPLGWAYLAILAMMLGTAAKPYYLAPAYTPLLAAGAVVVSTAIVRRGLRALLVLVIVGCGLVAVPLARPVLAVEAFVAYADALGMTPGTDERQALGRLPQFFADMHGWPEFAATVAAAHRSLPVAERAVACVVGRNYGEAGAIDFFGPALGLPRAISTHNNYFLWGPRDCSGEVVLIPAKDASELRELFARVEPGATFDCRDCMPYEDDLTIWVARGPRAALAELWPRLKAYQ
jgi:hypothetical protein